MSTLEDQRGAVRYRFRSTVDLQASDSRVSLTSLRPVRSVHLSPRAASFASMLARPEGASAHDAQELGPRLGEQVIDWLDRRGFIELVAPASWGRGDDLPVVSVVVVVRRRPRELARCMRGLTSLDWPLDRLEVVVVDDCSGDRTPAVARAFARWTALRGGPRCVVEALPCHVGISNARNAGVRATTGELIAFTDSDCVPAPDWLSQLTPYFRDERIGAVGGGVHGLFRRSMIQKYEHIFSPLRMGDSRTRAGRGTPVPYMPTCNLIVRQAALDSCDGFPPAVSLGEDVELCRRLEGRGWRLFFDPNGRVCHEHRGTLRTFLRRRFAYGASEGRLTGTEDQTAAGASAGMGFMGAATVGLVLGLISVDPLGGAIVLSLASLAILGLHVCYWYAAGRPVNLGVVARAVSRVILAVAHGIGLWVFRYWSLPVLVLCTVFAPLPVTLRLSAVLFILLLLTASVEGWRRESRLAVAPGALLFLFELTAYQVGAWYGAMTARRFSFLLPHAKSPVLALMSGAAARAEAITRGHYGVSHRRGAHHPRTGKGGA